LGGVWSADGAALHRSMCWRRGLVVLDGQQGVGAVLLHPLARGPGLGMEDVGADGAAVQSGFVEELAGAGLGVGRGVRMNLDLGRRLGLGLA